MVVLGVLSTPLIAPQSLCAITSAVRGAQNLVGVITETAARQDGA